ncbi:MAG TPA: PAS domain-containing sensor histidine kinase [Desulfobacteraceae bacterium]|nr:PAS domain-containing sensor histidine kinase [Desulfobacteraceae bacterium]
MGIETEKKYLLKAIGAFKRRFIVVSPEFKILAANCRLNGLADSETIGKHCHHVFYDRSSPCENCAVKESIEKRKPALMPKPESTLDLNEMPCFFSYPIYSGNEIEAYVSMDFDLPTRGGLEEKLQRSNAFLRNLISSAVDGIISSDTKGKILIFNEAAEKVFGYTVDEALNHLNVRDIYPDNNAYEVMRNLRSDDYDGKGKLKSYKVDIISKYGEIIPIMLNASIIYENGKEIATIGFFHDLREELRMKEELEKTQLQLLQAEKMSSLGKLAAGVAHQLNNPLGGITLFAKLILEEYDLEEGAKEDLNRILRDAKRCRDTVKELLEFTRQTRHLMRPHDINKALTRTLFLLESQTLFHNINIVKDLDSSLPLVLVDIQQLYHLFMNIILNAAQAMEGKGILTVKSLLLKSEEQVRIEISDTGPGISEENLPHIFEPFFTTKEEGKGTGLGLSLAYRIVQNHGGHLHAESRREKGTTFSIILPIGTQENKGDASGN